MMVWRTRIFFLESMCHRIELHWKSTSSSTSCLPVSQGAADGNLTCSPVVAAYRPRSDHSCRPALSIRTDLDQVYRPSSPVLSHVSLRRHLQSYSYSGCHTGLARPWAISRPTLSSNWIQLNLVSDADQSSLLDGLEYRGYPWWPDQAVIVEIIGSHLPSLPPNQCPLKSLSLMRL